MERTVGESIKAWENGEFSNPNTETQIEAGWYDWFCKESSLFNKTNKLFRRLKSILKVDNGRKINVNETYVFFKNNCPGFGSLYDDFRIVDIKTKNVIYTIVPSSGHNSVKGRAELWGKENDFQEALVAGSWKDIKAFFK